MKFLKQVTQIVQEDILGTDNRFMAIVWTACLTGVVSLGVYMSSESVSFLGIADSREMQVNFAYPVEIRRIHVIPGQNVKKGDLLIELDQSELNDKIRLIRQQLSKLQAEMNVRQHLNSIVNNGSDVGLQDPLAVDIEDFTEELEYLEEQKKNLYIFADVDGVVGGVAFKEGEKAPSFTGLVTLSPENPSYIQGFIHEQLRTRLEIGREVAVTPVSGGGEPVVGRVVSIGSRIVMMPPRMLPYPTMQVYGREVIVEIPSQNGLLLGEKVQLKPKMAWLPLSFSSAIASEGTPTALSAHGLPADEAPRNVEVPAELAKRFTFEPSGAVYLSDLKKFLVVSDDTDKKKSATLFLVDGLGKVESQTLLVPGVGKISDMESISTDGPYVYIMTSQGLNKKGKDKAARNLFIRSKRQGLRLLGTERLEFKPLLLAAFRSSSDANLKRFFNDDGVEQLEIESHLVENDKLFIGFKNPLDRDGKSLLLLIDGVDEIFKTKSLSSKKIQVLGLLDFGTGPGAPHHLSELIRIKGHFYAATVCHKEGCGSVWRLQPKDDQFVPELLRTFEGLKPEALALDESTQSLFVLFDRKAETAQFARVPLSPAKTTAQNQPKQKD